MDIAQRDLVAERREREDGEGQGQRKRESVCYTEFGKRQNGRIRVEKRKNELAKEDQE